MTDGDQGSRRIFHSVRAPGRARHLEAVVSSDGTIRIAGTDVSNGVLENDEFSSYEWTWIVRPAESARALAALGAQPGEDPARTLDRWMTADPRDPGMVISQAGVPIEFESRLGG
jgi:hypothetical protein